MRTKRRRFTIVAVAIWALALVGAGLIAPAPAEASVQKQGWMVYTPNHPSGCAPLPYDCYVIWIYPD
ncbi:MAG: hypothetical protein MUC56_10625 [Thermoanaerobaculales bacterium]|jgi:hypothetical protein|nr:hypothetical protein [Thermoanaerobaculales bacterium]